MYSVSSGQMRSARTQAPMELSKCTVLATKKDLLKETSSIIFVHGLGSNPDTTWGPKGTSWVSDFLPQDIPAVFHKDVRIFFYNYDSYWKRDAVQARLWSLGKSLLDHISSEIRGKEEVGSPIAPARANG